MLSPADTRRLRRNLEAIHARIADACARAGRDPGDVTLVAITKYSGPDFARALLSLGQRDLGENRVDHLLALDAALADAPVRPRWHMVGHLQRNKAHKVADLLAVLHSLDSPGLARRLEERRAADLPPLEAYVQVRMADVEGRAGVEDDDLPGLLAEVAGLTRLRVVGLMGLPPEGSAELARPHFQRLAALLARARSCPGGAGLERLSMGMTADLEVAIEEGATCVRVGRALLEGLSPDAAEPGA